MALVGYWKFNEANGNAADSSGNNRTLTNVGTCVYSACKLGNGVYPTTGKYFTRADEAGMRIGTDTYTIAFWLNQPASAGGRCVLNKANADADAGQILVIIDGTDKMSVYHGNFNLASRSNAAVDDGAWHHYVCTRNASNVCVMYIDGVAQTVSNTEATNMNTTGQFNIGLHTGVSPYPTNGYVDNVLFFIGTVWSQADVDKDYNNGSGEEYPYEEATNLQINIGDAWKEVSAMKINIGDVWRAVTKIQINIGDAWKTVFGT